MPSYLDFDTTKAFRNFILGKTLTVPNGPQSFTADSYSIQKTSDMSNIDPGDVETIRPNELRQSQTSNLFKPNEYFVNENISTIPRRANLSLYPYFETGQYHSFVSIMTGDDYSNESEMMKFAAQNIRTNSQGPFFGRMQQNLYTATAGKVRLLDALEGSLSTAINLVTGREPLVEGSSKITVDKTLVGKGVDFLQTVTGVEFPWSQIPGDYLSDPKNPIINRPTANSEVGAFTQDLTGAIGSMIGIERRPTTTRKPSDLFVEYMGHRQKSILFDNLSYSRYGPDYTTTARSQNSSKIFTFADNVGEGVKTFLGIEAPKMTAYIGDDRGNNVKDAMSDFNDRQVKSSYYLSVLFDTVQAFLFLRTKSIAEGGGIGGKLTWISSKSKNKLGANNDEYQSESSQFTETLSTKYPFRSDSILGLTQEILETLPTEGGAARSHVANVIDQTSRVFREDDVLMSRGSAVKYIDKFTGSESGVEYCRVWTKDRSYMNNSDTMKTTGLSRKFDSSVFSNAWNLNMYPNSNGNGGFDSSSTNMAKGMGDGFYAKKYMFSIENLAWKTSTRPGFTYNDLPYCERGPNGGRVMWFPPYGLRVTEQNSAKWEANTFLGRPEPVYTYQNTSRQGTIQFKVIVDHPSILNLLVKDHFKNMSDEEADNYINAFFAGCEDIDFYGLIRQYTTLTQTDVEKIQAYLNDNGDPNTIKKYKTVIRPAPDIVTPKNEIRTNPYNTELYYKNDHPNPRSTAIVTDTPYSSLYTEYEAYEDQYIDLLNDGLDKLFLPTGWTIDQQTDYKALTSQIKTTRPNATEIATTRAKAVADVQSGFTELRTAYPAFTDKLSEIKSGLSGKTVQNIKIQLGSRTSSIADDHYNLDLAYRRSFSVVKDIVNRLAKTQTQADNIMLGVVWKGPSTQAQKQSTESLQPIKLSDFGYESDGTFTIEYVENIGEQPIGSSGDGKKNVDCTENNKIETSSALKQTAPVTFWCRESVVSINYETKNSDEGQVTVPYSGTEELEISNEPTNPPSPPIDEMKRIVMKTLSECYYFKKLEEDSPLQFSSLKEKLRYFHPSFHSMTPEGLNGRLTFLQQCIRPGETLPIKGISDISDLNARNTTFGPPPICVMRIGDFYHSKVAITDVNFEFEQDLWDLNPEGIGVQPMIANVTLQLYFIGGHGLERPVEKLQNALSSNFYANTEMYDPRSISTEKTIGGQDATKFTKEFLNTLVKDNTKKSNPTSQDPVATEEKIDSNAFIGEGVILAPFPLPISFNYKPLVDNLILSSTNYYNTFSDGYNNVVKKYGPMLSSIILSPTYRTISDYVVQTGPSTQTIQLLGNYPKTRELEVLVRDFKSKILDKIKNENISTIFGFNNELTPPKLRRSEELLNPHIYKRIGEILDGISQNSVKKNVEKTRNDLIKVFDKLNFFIETSHDGSVNDKNNTYVGVNFTGYTYDLLYNRYSDVVRYILEAEPLFYEDLDTTSFVFDRNTTMTTQNLSDFLSELLNSTEEKQKIMNLYKEKDIFTDRITNNLSKKLNKFMTPVPSDKDFSRVVVKRKPIDPKTSDIIFGIENYSYTFTDDQKTKLRDVNKLSFNGTTSTLNYYRNG